MGQKHKEIEVSGTQRVRVTVDPLIVMEKEYDRSVPRHTFLKEIDGKFYILCDDQLDDDISDSEISKEEFDYLTSLKFAIRALLTFRVWSTKGK